MAAMLPPSTNAQYVGSMFSAWLLTVLAVLTIVPGLIHIFLPDGGAGTIAGLDLSTNRRTVVGLFAWAGATQIALGIVMLVVSLRYRSLVPLLLGVVLLERALHALNGWVPKGAARITTRRSTMPFWSACRSWRRPSPCPCGPPGFRRGA